MIKSDGIFASRMKSYGCEYILIDFECLIKIWCLSLSNFSTHYTSLRNQNSKSKKGLIILLHLYQHGNMQAVTSLQLTFH
ncbi:hypothetical protein HanRHA438_Chr10g0438031 [Helianthus annuus]|nr:hypothetical protein HanRHA438_Chr10g0438031 [Helianthus annuus]